MDKDTSHGTPRRITVRVWIVAAVCILLAGCFTACVKQGNPGTTDPAGSDEETQSVLEVETREPLNLPNVRYDGEEFCILVDNWDSDMNHTAAIVPTEGSFLGSAVYERNQWIQETYGVTVVHLTENGALSIGRVANEVAAPTGDFEAVVAGSISSLSQSKQNLLWDLNSDTLVHLDVTKPWWDTNISRGLSIKNRLYCATGDLLTTDNDATYAILFNRGWAERAEFPNLYELAINGQWTLNQLYELEQAVAKDQNEDGSMSYTSDLYGFAYSDLTPLLVGGGITLCQKDANDIPAYRLDEDRALQISKLGKQILSEDLALDLDTVSSGGLPPTFDPLPSKVFWDGGAMFLNEWLYDIFEIQEKLYTDYGREYTFNLGVLPVPKYDEAQENYAGFMHRDAGVVSIPKSVSGDSLAMTEILLEAMAYRSVDTVTPQYYEYILTGKQEPDQAAAKVLDIILANRACDAVYYFGWASNYVNDFADTLRPDNSASISILNRSYSRIIQNIMDHDLKNMD